MWLCFIMHQTSQHKLNKCNRLALKNACMHHLLTQFINIPLFKVYVLYLKHKTCMLLWFSAGANKTYRYCADGLVGRLHFRNYWKIVFVFAITPTSMWTQCAVFCLFVASSLAPPKICCRSLLRVELAAVCTNTNIIDDKRPPCACRSDKYMQLRLFRIHVQRFHRVRNCVADDRDLWWCARYLMCLMQYFIYPKLVALLMVILVFALL